MEDLEKFKPLLQLSSKKANGVPELALQRQTTIFLNIWYLLHIHYQASEITSYLNVNKPNSSLQSLILTCKFHRHPIIKCRTSNRTYNHMKGASWKWASNTRCAEFQKDARFNQFGLHTTKLWFSIKEIQLKVLWAQDIHSSPHSSRACFPHFFLFLDSQLTNKREIQTLACKKKKIQLPTLVSCLWLINQLWFLQI